MASIWQDYGASFVAFTVFSVLHTLGAREELKQLLSRYLGRFAVVHFWRLLYCGLSFWALYFGVSSLIWVRNPENNQWLVMYPSYVWQCLVALHFFSIALLYIAFIQSDYLEFLGFKQAWQGFRALLGKPYQNSLPIFGTDRLVTRGIYAWVRHPMLSAGFLFLLTSGPSLNNLVYILLYTMYMLIGGYFEERRLTRIFGEDYRRYKRQVDAFFPKRKVFSLFFSNYT